MTLKKSTMNLRRFKDIRKLEPFIRFMYFPFPEANNIEDISTKINLFFFLIWIRQKLNLGLKKKSDIFFKLEVQKNLLESIERRKTYMFKRGLHLHAYFWLTCLCETAFSHMKIIKTEY